MSDPIPSKKRTRSPAYPAIDLQEAIAKAATLWEKLSRHWGGAETAVTFWGYEKDSSGGYSALSALIKYGLLEDQGSSQKREVRLTEAGVGLIYHADTSSDEHRKALRKAALLPSIHAELWKRYAPELPHDSVIERYLVLERGFNSAYVKGFINQFRKTIAFSDLNGSDMQPIDEAEEVHSAPTLGPSKMHSPILQARHSAPTPTPTLAASPAHTEGRREIRLPHPAGDITVTGPFPLSHCDWATFMSLLSTFQTWLVDASSPPVKPTPQASFATASLPPAERSPSDAQG